MGMMIFIAVDVVILIGLIGTIYYCYTRFYKRSIQVAPAQGTNINRESIGENMATERKLLPANHENGATQLPR